MKQQGIFVLSESAIFSYRISTMICYESNEVSERVKTRYNVLCENMVRWNSGLLYSRQT